MIRFQGVHKWFKKLHVLNDINLQVRQGEVLVVCGPSGSGKSTLIRTVNRLEPIDKGTLVVDGQDLCDPKTDINRLRAEIGFVFQQFNLYPHLSVLKNITLAPIKIRNTSRKEAEEQAMVLSSGSASRTRGTLIPHSFRGDSSKGWPSRGRSR
jgi:polar amino acid transport system ATP-binding protein